MAVSSIILDIIVAGLLVMTIGYAMVLNKKISGLRRDKAQLEKLASTFSAATAKAGTHLSDLQKTASMLEGQIKTATTLRDDLAFLVDRGGRTADKLENAVRHSRDDSGVDLRDMGTHPVFDEKHGKPQAAVHDFQTGKPRPVRPMTKEAVRAGASSSAQQRPVREPAGLEPRSEAERDLLRALRAAR